MNLAETLGNVKEWLIFAEAKNAALLALIAVVGVPIAPLILHSNVLFSLYAVIATVLLAISAFLALISFLPKLDIQFGTPNHTEEEFNLIFFGSISSIQKSEYIQLASESYGISDDDLVAPHVVEQVYNLSRITSRKMFLFKWALWFAIAGIFTPVSVLVLLIVAKNDRQKARLENSN